MILAQVKLPEGVRAAGGALTSSTMLNGSPFASHFWFANRTYTRDLLFAGISHEFYHQITFWLTRDLSYDPQIFPSNDPPNTIAVRGRELLPARETRREWYTHVLSRVLTDEMWRAMLRWQEEASIWNDENLAYGARATTGDVRDLVRLNDGSLGWGGLREAATSDPASRTPVEAWFGLEFDEPTIISRVTVYPSLRQSDPTYLATSFVREYQTAGRWRPIRGTTRTQNQDERVDFVFLSISVRRVRLRILDEQPDERGAFYRASVLEIEGYGR